MVLRGLKRIRIGNKYYNGCTKGKIELVEKKIFSLASNNPDKELSLIKKNIRKPINRKVAREDVKVVSY